MPFHLIESREGVARIEDEWRDLESRTCPHVFQTYGFVAPWLEHVGQAEGIRPAIFLYRERGELAGVLPTCVARAGPVGLVTWMGGLHVVDYGDVLFDPERAALSVGEFLDWGLEAIGCGSPSRLCYLPNVRGDAIAREELDRRFILHREGAAPYAVLEGDFDLYLESRRPHFRRYLRKRLGRLVRCGEIRCQVLDPGDPERGPVMDALFEQKRRRLETIHPEAAVLRPTYQAFYREQALANPTAHVSCLRAGDDIVATMFGYLYGDRLCCLLTSYDARYSRCAPGHLIHYELIRRCCETGVAIFDLGAGAEAYKREWTDRRERLSCFVEDSLSGRLFSAARRVRHRHAADRSSEVGAVRS